MKNFLTLSLILAIYWNLPADEIVELDPFVIESRSSGLWDMSLRYTFLESSESQEDIRISQYEVLSVLKNGSADTHGLKTGDIILEFDGRKNLSPKEIDDFLREGEEGDVYPIKLRKKNGEEAVVEIKLHDAMVDPCRVIMCGVEIEYPADARYFARKEKEDIYILSQSSAKHRTEGKNVLVMKGTSPIGFFTPQDQKPHKFSKKKYIKFDQDGEYEIKRK